jgi:hypothetical protein
MVFHEDFPVVSLLFNDGLLGKSSKSMVSSHVGVDAKPRGWEKGR